MNSWNRVGRAAAGLLVAVLVGWTWPGTARADNDVICSVPFDSRNPMAWEQVRARNDLPAEITPANYLRDLSAVRNDFVERAEFWGVSNQEDVRRFLTILSRIQGEESELVPVFENDDDAENAWMYRAVASLAFKVPCARTPDDTPSYQVEMGHAAWTVRHVLAQSKRPFLRVADRNVQRTALAYENLLTHGMAMWPWELWVNGLWLGGREVDKPPRSFQLVVARPSAGLEINTGTRDDGVASPTLGIEWLGFIHYTDVQEFDRWWGASFLMTLPQDRGRGLGALVRYSPWGSLGVTWKNDVAAHKDDWFVYVGLDLSRFLAKHPDRLNGYASKIPGEAGETARKLLGLASGAAK